MENNNRLQILLDKYLQDRCTEGEVHLLLDYMKRAEHEPQIKKILTDYWQRIDDNDLPAENDLEIDEGTWLKEIQTEAIEREYRQIPEPPKISKSKLSRFPKRNSHSARWFIGLKVAAILVFTVTLSYLFYIYQQNALTNSITQIEKIANAGEKVRFVLPDGTQVHLNSESSLIYPSSFSDSARVVQLRGEGFFVVTPDQERPFLVHTNDITTKVLGTSFNIRSYPEDNTAVVAVRSGKVSVSETGFSGQDSNVVLESNEYANYTFTNRQFTTGEGIMELTAWNSGVLLYHNKELGEVTFQLERWYDVDIYFENEAIKKCMVRGEHRDESLTTVLKAITYAFDIEYQIEGRRVLLIGDGCN